MTYLNRKRIERESEKIKRQLHSSEQIMIITKYNFPDRFHVVFDHERTNRKREIRHKNECSAFVVGIYQIIKTATECGISAYKTHELLFTHAHARGTENIKPYENCYYSTIVSGVDKPVTGRWANCSGLVTETRPTRKRRKLRTFSLSRVVYGQKLSSPVRGRGRRTIIFVSRNSRFLVCET